MFTKWFSILCIISITSAVPLSVFPVRPYVFLAPELPKFALQPALKVQPASVQSVQPVSNVAKPTEPTATRQYVLVYPPVQYLTTRQDETSNGGFFESLQNYFINFGSSQTQNQESSQIMDAVDADKLQVVPTETKPILVPAQEKPNAEPNQINQKFFYSYATPASTVPLTTDRRFYLLSEQPQILGSFGGSALNPVFNFQPVPVVVSRSNVAQSDDPVQPGKEVAENVQISQVPPVMNTVVEPASSQVQAKSVASEPSPAVVVEPVSENRLAPAPIALPDVDNRAIPVEPTSQSVVEPTVEAKSAVVVAEPSVVEPVPSVTSPEVVASAEPVITNTVVSIASVPTVIEARSNPVPLTVTSESVAPLVASPVVASSVVQAVVEGNESVVQQSEVVAPSVKEVPSVVAEISLLPTPLPAPEALVQPSEPVATASA